MTHKIISNHQVLFHLAKFNYSFFYLLEICTTGLDLQFSPQRTLFNLLKLTSGHWSSAMTDLWKSTIWKMGGSLELDLDDGFLMKYLFLRMTDLLLFTIQFFKIIESYSLFSLCLLMTWKGRFQIIPSVISTGWKAFFLRKIVFTDVNVLSCKGIFLKLIQLTLRFRLF